MLLHHLGLADERVLEVGWAELDRSLEPDHLTAVWVAQMAPPVAVELAREHGVYSVAHPLRLDYMRLKKRLGGVPRLGQKVSSPAFVELIAPQAGTLKECVIEFESPRGGKVRIQWKASVAPDWTSLLRSWRETENR